MPQPPRLLEAVFAICIPPSCREEVLGDLCEKYVSPLQYVLLALRTIPFIVLSRARRVTEAPILFMEALLIYASYLTAAWYGDRVFLYSPYGLLRLAFPLLPFLLTLVLFDVYCPHPKSALRMMGPVAFAALATFCSCLAQPFARWTNLVGSSTALLLVSALRVLFRSHPDVQPSAGPGHWLKQTPAPIALPRNAFAVVGISAAVTAGAILLLSGGSKPGVIGGLIAVVLIFTARLSGSRKE